VNGKQHLDYLDIVFSTNHDTPADAVREDRCIGRPTGCGQPLIAEDGTARTYWVEAEAAEYEAEWRATGLCPDCQDAADTGAAL
jgi:hypothetical protein